MWHRKHWKRSHRARRPDNWHREYTRRHIQSGHSKWGNAPSVYDAPPRDHLYKQPGSFTVIYRRAKYWCAKIIGTILGFALAVLFIAGVWLGVYAIVDYDDVRDMLSPLIGERQRPIPDYDALQGLTYAQPGTEAADLVKSHRRDSLSDKPKIDINGVERLVHELINTERQKKGLSALQWDAQLTDIARRHSKDMAQRNFFAHYNPDGKDPTARGEQLGYRCFKDYGSYYTEGIAENIYQDTLYSGASYSTTSLNGVPTESRTTYYWNYEEDFAKRAVQSWMNSPGHRKNILTETYTQEGIGVAVDDDTINVYITENFC